MEQEVKLGYWGIQGYGEYARFALAYAGVKWEEYNPESREAWAEIKPNLGYDFPNLPFLQVGEFKITESSAIAFYIARKFKPSLLGNNHEEEAKILEIINVLTDIDEQFYEAVYSDTAKEDFEALKSKDTVVTKIGYLAKFLGENNFLVGESLTLADIYVAIFLFTFEKMYKSVGVENWVFSSYKNLEHLFKRVYLEVDGIKQLVASEEWKSRPIYRTSILSWMVNDMTIN